MLLYSYEQPPEIASAFPQPPTSTQQPLPTPHLSLDTSSNSLDFHGASPTYRREYPSLAVSLSYSTHELHGALILVPQFDFSTLLSRFYDITPQSSDFAFIGAQLARRPWVLLNETLGLTWADVQHLPLEAYMSSAHDVLSGDSEPSFVAMTDRAVLFAQGRLVPQIGKCSLDGKLVVDRGLSEYADDLIIALDSCRPFAGVRKNAKEGAFRWPQLEFESVVDWPPYPASPDLLQMIEILQAACKDEALLTAGRLRKTWVRTQFPHLIDRGHMAKHHELFQHRGNEAMFPRATWQHLCYPQGSTSTKALEARQGQVGEAGHLPEPYYQVLFLDLQQRPRVPGTDRLVGVDAKYYEDVKEEQRKEAGLVCRRDKLSKEFKPDAIRDTDMANVPQSSIETAANDR